LQESLRDDVCLSGPLASQNRQACYCRTVIGSNRVRPNGNLTLRLCYMVRHHSRTSNRGSRYGNAPTAAQPARDNRVDTKQTTPGVQDRHAHLRTQDLSTSAAIALPLPLGASFVHQSLITSRSTSRYEQSNDQATSVSRYRKSRSRSNANQRTERAKAVEPPRPLATSSSKSAAIPSRTRERRPKSSLGARESSTQKSSVTMSSCNEVPRRGECKRQHK